MAQIVFEGRTRDRLHSMFALMGVSTKAVLSRIIGRSPLRDWPVSMEIGNLFWRHQFRVALARMEGDPDGARAYFDSLQTYTDEVFEVERSPAPHGEWLTPKSAKPGRVLLYFHGGGYAFHAAISRRFAETLAEMTQSKVFAADYRLTPEHGHPAQAEDALTAYRYLLEEGHGPQEIVLVGDSAGGHMVLMALLGIKEEGLPQPALAIGLCPWTHIGAHGDSLEVNNPYDLVQGDMAVQFGKWLRAGSGKSEEDLSPIAQDYRSLAPIYLQGGGREVLIDMIRDFAEHLQGQERQILLDVWETMTHNFQSHGTTRPESLEAMERMSDAIEAWTSGDGSAFKPCDRTTVFRS